MARWLVDWKDWMMVACLAVYLECKSEISLGLWMDKNWEESMVGKLAEWMVDALVEQMVAVMDT
jgi:hypothetical protein